MKKCVLCLFAVVLFLTGCGAEKMEDVNLKEMSEAAESIRQAANDIATGNALDTKEEGNAQDQADSGSAGENGEKPLLHDISGMEKYAYSCLSDEEKALYQELYAILKEQDSDVEVSTCDIEMVDNVFQYVMTDHPELFYVDGYSVNKYMQGEELKKLTASGTYTYSPEEVADLREQIGSCVDKILQKVPAGGGEYEKVKFVYEYLIEHTEYDLAAEDNQNICSVFLNQRSVCQGYAKAAQYLFDKIGIYSTLVTGTVSSGAGHAWNLVRVDGEYYYVDPTWGDASYVMGEGDSGYQGNPPSINYEYLCVTTEQLCRTHTIDPVIPMPECNSMKNNYYVREGAYFEAADMEKVRGLFEKSYENGTECVTLKCADDDVYRELQRRLIEEQEVFHYLHSEDRQVAFSDNPKQNSLSFWL